MTLVTNIGKIPECIPPITWQPQETLDVPVNVAQFAHHLPQFAVDWEDNLKDKVNGKLAYLTFAGWLSSVEGYGLLGITTLRQLTKAGVHVSVHNPPHPTSVVRSLLKDAAPDILAITDRPDTYPTRVGVNFGYPSELKNLPTPIRILSTMYETTRLPDNWDKEITKADAIIVPCEGQVQIFRDSGCKQPIFTVPSGFDMANWPYVERQEKDIFTFISWSRMSSRKMPFETIQCFQNAFPNNDDVRLIMKTRNNDFGGGQVGGIPTIGDSRITIINQDWSQEKLYQAAAEADCGIFLSRGEGFFQPPIQAMATGMTVIGPNHSGCSAWADPKYCYVVGLNPSTPHVQALGMGQRDGKELEWWNPNLDEAVSHLRYVYSHRAEARKKGKAASAWVHKKFSEDAMGRDLIKALNTV